MGFRGVIHNMKFSKGDIVELNYLNKEDHERLLKNSGWYRKYENKTMVVSSISGKYIKIVGSGALWMEIWLKHQTILESELFEL